MNEERNDASSTAVFDRDGFLMDPAMWSENLAGRVARDDGLGELSELQLSLLRALRQEFSRHGGLPSLHHVCHQIGQDPDCAQQLFPTPREAWRLAGLPHPGEEAKAYLGDQPLS